MAVELTGLAPYSYLVVGVVAAIMTWLSWRSYQNTGNVRLLFVVIAFIAMILKALIIMVNEWGTHTIGHHPLIVVMGALDVLIVLLLFVPFLAPPKARKG